MEALPDLMKEIMSENRDDQLHSTQLFRKLLSKGIYILYHIKCLT